MKNRNRIVIFILKLVVSVGLLGYIITRIDGEQFAHTLASANFSYIALALVIYLGTQVVSALRWTVLARPLGIRTPYKDLTAYYFIGMFFNLFAPSTVGGDVSRVYYLAREENRDQHKRASGSTIQAAVSVLMDRGIGMVVLIWLGALGLLLFPEYEVPRAIRALTFSLSVAFLIGGLLLPLVRRVLPEDAHPLITKLRVILTSYRKGWRVIPQAITLSFMVHLVQAWMHVIMGLALHLSLPLSFCIIVYPLVGTFSALPISVNGFGLREGGYIFLLALIGIDSEEGIAFGLLLFLIVAVDSLIGGILFLVKKDSVAAGAVSAEV
ncbi:MAG TPA: lysylphosphatidylglycerol synthase transmembrane domain-containing protein [Candidatus Binatia bacterium]|jgi:glycosyltransferase 2 family protein